MDSKLTPDVVPDVVPEPAPVVITEHRSFGRASGADPMVVTQVVA